MDERRKNTDSEPRNRKPAIIDHSIRVSYYSVCIASELGYSSEAIRELSAIANVHDVGKIYVADKVLFKSEILDEDEKSIMDRHPEHGAELLKPFDYFHERLSFKVLTHHEKYDGTGYPFGLAGKEIPLESRIISVADAFDALTSDIGYNAILSIENALKELVSQEGRQFDPNVVRIFISYIRKNYNEINQIVELALQNKSLEEQLEEKIESLSK